MAKARGSGGVAKKAKDPNAPKRAMSAFFLWMQANRASLKKPGMGVGMLFLKLKIIKTHFLFLRITRNNFFQKVCLF